MNQTPRDLSAVKAIDLAAEADFALGGLSIRPPLREVRAGERRETVEPRVMQVLVALARADGVVVSRDQLIERCWGGRLVGDDAINSCVAKVRALAAMTAPAAFEIETVPRVGYRLLRARPKDRLAVEPVLVSLQIPAAAADSASQPGAVRFGLGRVSLFAAIVMALAAAVAAIAILMPKPAKQWEVVESHQPFISTPDLERFPSFSPDGTMIAYSRGKNIQSQRIFLQLRRGGDPLRLTPDGVNAFSPAFAPDGTSVAYVGFQEKHPCRLMLAQVPSGPSREIGRCRSAEVTSLGWDHNGHALFYEDRFNASQFLHIVRYDIDTGVATQITRSGESGSVADYQPAMSPDGNTLLFFRYLKGDRLQLVLRAMKDGSQRVLVDDDADKYAAWSEDSSTVFVARNQGSDSSLWAYPVSGAAPWRITSNSRPMESLASGPDGLLAFQLKNQAKELAIASTAANETSRALDANGFDGCSFDYAPDGTFALVANIGESPIIAVGAPGSLHEILRLKGAMPCGIRWSPDGTKLAFGNSDDSGFRISVVDRNGLPVAQLPYPTQEFGYFEWTPDGKGMLEARLDSRGWRVWRIDLAPPNSAVPILPFGWRWTREYKGMLFGVKVDSPGIWRIDGTPKRLTDWPSAERFWAWTIADDKLLYVDLSHPGQRLIVAQPIAGGPQTVVAHTNDMNFFSLLAVNPKDGRITYNRDLRDDPDIGWIRLARR